jgi:hypothetical protein
MNKLENYRPENAFLMKRKKENKLLTFVVGVGRIIPKTRECRAVKYIKCSVRYSMTAAPILTTACFWYLLF